MPFFPIHTSYPTLQRLAELRRNSALAHGLSVVLVLIAALLRWLIGPQDGLPFITFFPAITVATLVGGLWPGLLALSLSAAMAWYFFLPHYAWAAGYAQLFSVFLFVLMSMAIIGVIALLHNVVDRLIEQERNVRQLIERMPTGIIVVARDGRIRLVNAAAELLFRYDRQELIGKSIDELLPSRHARAHKRYRDAYAASPEERPMGLGRDLSALRKDGVEFHCEVGLKPLKSGEETFTIATVVDVSERRLAQERDRLLSRELQHRAQNLLAVVQAIAKRTFASNGDADEAQEIFRGRLQALSAAHRALSRGEWKGAPLREIVKAEVSAFGSQIELNGCELAVHADAAQNLALIVHELATNATKHGALSSSEGRVKVSGFVEKRNNRDLLVFRWIESNGKPVNPPDRKGFGTVILESVAKSFAEDVTLEFASEGLRYELAIALDRAAATARAPVSQ